MRFFITITVLSWIAAGAIASLSLAGPAVMDFRCGEARRALALPPRSLMVMANEARYAWQHCIPHRKADAVSGARIARAPRRVSLTLRRARRGPCRCEWPDACDSQGGGMPPTRRALAAAAAEDTPCGSDRAVAGDGSAVHGTDASDSSSQTATSCKGLGQARCERAETEGTSNQPVPSGQAREALAMEQCLPAALDAGHGQNRPGLTLLEEQQMASNLSGSDAGGMLQKNVSNPLLEASMEEEHVHNVYNVIAQHFSATRFAVWPKVC